MLVLPVMLQASPCLIPTVDRCGVGKEGGIPAGGINRDPGERVCLPS